MKITIHTHTISETLDIEVLTLAHLKSYLQAHPSKEISQLPHQELVYLLVDKDDPNKTTAIPPEFAGSEFGSATNMIITLPLRGEIWAVAVAVAAAVATGVAATVLAVVIAAVIYVAIAIVLAYVIKLLTPNPDMGDEKDLAEKQRSLIFNGVRNITEQGGGVPLLFGNVLAGGVVIGVKTSVTIPTNPLLVNGMQDAMGRPSEWLKLR